jgi:hypothetical protein
MLYLRSGLDCYTLAWRVVETASPAAKDRTSSVMWTFAAATHEILVARIGAVVAVA